MLPTATNPPPPIMAGTHRPVAHRTPHPHHTPRRKELTMTTNIDRAAEVLRNTNVIRPHRGMDAYASAVFARALSDAGLLAPDLTEPQVVPTGMEDRVYLSWRGDPVDVEQSARITELFAPGESFPILSLDADQARSLGLRLLAAADYAERNQE